MVRGAWAQLCADGAFRTARGAWTARGARPALARAALARAALGMDGARRAGGARRADRVRRSPDPAQPVRSRNVLTLASRSELRERCASRICLTGRRAGCRYKPLVRRRGRGDRWWRRASAVARGKSELHRAGCWLTASRGDSQDSATESRPPIVRWVRVKRCGKSAPPLR